MRHIKFTVLAPLVGMALVMALSGCDRMRSAETIVARGDAQYERGNFRAAVGDFKTALQRDAGNVSARIGLARALQFLGEFEDAEHSIDAALASDASNVAAIELRQQILLSRGKYDEVVKTLATDSKLSESNRSLLLGRAYAGLGDPTQAANAYARALELSPNNTKVLVAQAQLFAGTGDLKRAGEITDAVLSQDAENAAAWVIRSALRDAHGDLPGAKIAIESAEKFSPRQLNWSEQARVSAAMADINLRLNNADGAAHAIAGLNRRAPQAAITYYLQARLAILNKNSTDAVAQLQKGLQITEYLPSRLLLANVQLSQGSYGQAETHLDKILHSNPDNADARKMLAQLYLATNRAADAQRLLSSSVADKAQSNSQSANAQIDWLRGQALIAAGARDEGLVLLEKSLAADHTDINRSLQLARTYIENGVRDKAIALLESLPVDAGGTQRQGLLLMASVIGKSAADSVKAIDALLARYPKDSTLCAIAGVLFAQSGRVDRGTELLNQAVAFDNTNLEARLLFASVLLKAGKHVEAERQLQAVMAVDPKNVMAFAGLAKVALATGHKDQAVRYLEQAIGAQPSVIEPRLQLAQIAMADKDEKRANDLLDQAVTAANGAPAVINAVGVMQLQMQQFDGALLRFESAGAKGYVLAKLNAARALIALGRKNEARLRLDPLIHEPTVRLPASALLTRIDAEEGNYSAALATLDSMRKMGGGKQADANQIDELAGDIHTMAKQYDQAQILYGRAYQANSTRQLAIKRFQALAAGHDSKAPTALLAWLTQTLKDTLVRQLLAKYYVKAGDNTAALREYEAWLSASAVRDPEMLNDLAWLYGEKGDDRALPLALEAYTARPTSVEIADTYAWILVRKNETAKALPILEKAAQSAQPGPEVQYHYAFALSKVGDRARAKTLLQDLMVKSPQFPSRREAEQLLQTVSN